jgi:hypothetical protein
MWCEEAEGLPGEVSQDEEKHDDGDDGPDEASFFHQLGK